MRVPPRQVGTLAGLHADQEHAQHAGRGASGDQGASSLAGGGARGFHAVQHSVRAQADRRIRRIRHPQAEQVTGARIGTGGAYLGVAAEPYDEVQDIDVTFEDAADAQAAATDQPQRPQQGKRALRLGAQTQTAQRHRHRRGQRPEVAQQGHVLAGEIAARVERQRMALQRGHQAGKPGQKPPPPLADLRSCIPGFHAGGQRRPAATFPLNAAPVRA